jgi:hypothetical protein
MVSFCCRKAATKGRKLLCAAAGASQPKGRKLLCASAGASQPPGHLQRQPASKRLPRPGSALAGFFWRRRSCYGERQPSVPLTQIKATMRYRA